MSRDSLIAAFLDRHGYAGATSERLAQDASARRYLRLRGGPRPALLMDAPPPEDVRPFLRIGAHLGAIGLSTPEIYAADEEAGFLLLEDFGDGVFPAALTDANRESLFGAAIDALAAMQAAETPPLPSWGPEMMEATALGTLLDWWWPAAMGGPAPEAARADFAAAMRMMLRPLADGPLVFVHRDYFADNLMWLPDRRGARRVGVLDFQSAALGHPAYDLVSLIEDDRRDLPRGLADRMQARLLAARPSLDPEEFAGARAVCAAQRHARVAALWVRLARRDGRPHYLAHGARSWRLLDEALRHPATAALKAAFDRWIPPDRRANPPDQFRKAE